jgi:hypothetical protein
VTFALNKNSEIGTIKENVDMLFNLHQNNYVSNANYTFPLSLNAA